LNIYRRILQEHYNEVVSELALVVLHPNQSSYRVVRLNMMDDEVEAMFQTRRARLAALAAAALEPATPTVADTAFVTEEDEEPAEKGKPVFVEED
jgi:hypothetical protein